MIVIQIDGMNKDIDDGSALVHIIGGHLADIVQKGQNLRLRQRDLLIFLNSELRLQLRLFCHALVKPFRQHHHSRRGGGRSPRHRRRGSCVLDRQHHANAGGRSCGILPHRGKSGQGGAGQRSPPRRKRGIRSCVKSAINSRFISSCAR